MNNFFTEDVMRALECCADTLLTCPAKNCPLINECNCQEILAEKALALLREKDAEIERLRAENDIYTRGIEEISVNYHKQGRAEAITEFADRIIRFYNALPGKTVGGSVEYHVKQVRDTMLKETEVTS